MSERVSGISAQTEILTHMGESICSLISSHLSICQPTPADSVCCSRDSAMNIKITVFRPTSQFPNIYARVVLSSFNENCDIFAYMLPITQHTSVLVLTLRQAVPNVVRLPILTMDASQPLYHSEASLRIPIHLRDTSRSHQSVPLSVCSCCSP